MQIANHAVLSATAIEKAHQLDHFTAPYLEEKLLKEGVFATSEEYNEAFDEFKKFAFICSLYEKPIGMIGEEVDNLWHQFILFTPLYREFCNTYIGKFLDHMPDTSFSKSGDGSVKHFVRHYLEIFGDLSPIWQQQKLAGRPSEEMILAGCGASPSCKGCWFLAGCGASPSCKGCWV